MAVGGDAFRGIMRRVPCGVVVVTAATGEGARGMTAGSFTSLSLEPPLVCFNVMKSSRVHGPLTSAGRFAINLLGEDQAEVAARFAEAGLDGPAQFDGIPHRLDGHGTPLIGESIGWILCSRRDVFPGGDHSIILGAVEEVLGGRDVSPLLYLGGEYCRVGGPARRG